uniref:high light inducible protein n=1 Tax=Cryptomonas pyrenoidifera TaxID=233184 RepID=UPI0022A6EB5B|nr:high light inducible protein [Cryptomonas pyrenoidifera]UZS90583.1 high light inducible protein [Cryptomonas pyrenoidifera]
MCRIPLFVNNSMSIVPRKPNIANLPFQFSAEVVKPQTQGKNLLSFSIQLF